MQRSPTTPKALSSLWLLAAALGLDTACHRAPPPEPTRPGAFSEDEVRLLVEATTGADWSAEELGVLYRDSRVQGAAIDQR